MATAQNEHTDPGTGVLGAQAFDLIQQGQEATMTLLGALSENWSALARGGSATGGALPGTSAMPDPAEMVDRVYDTGIQILEAQRAMAHGMVNAAMPAVRAFTAPATSAH